MNTPLGTTITLKTDFTTALTRVTDALKAEGFGVLTEIDVKETLKKKLGVDFTPYKILGACGYDEGNRQSRSPGGCPGSAGQVEPRGFRLEGLIGTIQGEYEMNEPMHVNDGTFEKAVLQSRLPVLVDFWAPWCGPCRMVAPVLEKLAKEYEGKLVVAKVNTDENPEWATRYGVSGIPTMLFIAGGEVLHEQVGAVPPQYLKQIVEKFLEITAKSAEAVAAQIHPIFGETHAHL